MSINGDLRAAAALRHANIVEVIDVARTPEDEYFVVTEFVDGCDLKNLVSRSERIPPAVGLHVVVECCKGLAHAHLRAVIHRELSPGAVLLDTKGEVKLMKFGFAKATAVDPALDIKLVLDSESSARAVDQTAIEPAQESVNHMVSIVENETRAPGTWN